MLEWLQAAGLKAVKKIAMGIPAVEIIRLSAGLQADLIVMATHGRSGRSRLRLGSVAAKVVQGIQRSVLLVRERLAWVSRSPWAGSTVSSLST